MSTFKINDKTENTNPDSQSYVLVEKTGQPGVYEKVKLQNLPSNGTGGIEEAPEDGNQYARKDAGWEQVSATGSGDMEASTYDPQSIAADSFDRTNHTGEQDISTVTNLQTELDAKELKSSQVAFTEEKTFTGNTRSYTSQTGDINLTIASTGQPTSGEYIHEDIIDGNSTNAINLTVDGGIIGSSDNTKRNIISLVHNADLALGKTRAIISTVAIPTAPTQPLVSSATVENGADTQLVVLFDQDSNIVDTTGLSLNFTSGTPLTITGIASGAGTSTITFTLSGSVQVGDVFSFVYDGTNTITGLVGGLSLAAGSTSVTNNVGEIPSLSSAVVEDTAKNLVLVTFANNVDTNNITGVSLNFTSGTAKTINAYVSGTGTNTITYQTSADIEFGDVFTIDYDGTNTITSSASGNSLPISSVSVTNNVAQVLLPQDTYALFEFDNSNLDSDGNLTATDKGTVTYSNTTKKFGTHSFFIDGTDTTTAIDTDFKISNSATDLTISMWLYFPSSTSGVIVNCFQAFGSGTDQHGIYKTSSDNVTFNGPVPGSWDVSSLFDQWINYTVTIDVTNQIINAYGNSTLVGTSSINVNNFTNDFMRFARTGAGSTAKEMGIDRTRIYQRLLTTQEITQIANEV